MKAESSKVTKRRLSPEALELIPSGELLAVPSDHSDDSSSEISEEISVLETPENQSYERKVTIGLLSRAGYREHYWRNKISSYFFILSFLMTYDTVALFFQSTHEYGIFFIVNFGICMMLIGFPMCYLEMALGQYTSTGIFLVFDRMAPGFVGVAISALTLNFLHMCTHHDAFIDIFSIAAQSGVITSSQKPWKHCLDPSATKQCYTWPRNCDDMEYTNDIPQYPKHLAFESITYSKLIYDEIDDFNTWQKLKYPSSTYLLLTMTVALFLIHILTRTKKALLIILNSALVITFCVLLFILHSTLTFFTPKRPYALPITIGMSKALFNWEAWRSAVALTFRALNLGQGAWTFFGSLFGFHNNLQFDPFTVVSSFLDSLHIFGDYEPMMTFAYSLAQSITLLSNKIVRLEIIISAITEMNVTFSSQSSHNVVVILVVLFGTVCQMFALYEKAGSKKGKLAINSMMLVLWAVVIPVLAIVCS
uniref:Amino acid transporter n=1 Tax=Angiostrongylus cantonensis TaxID=6313 RepID=A0A158P8I4_ANGCA